MELRRRCTLLQNGCHVYSLKLCDGYTWWRHQMETFSTLLALCEGNLPATGRSPPPPPPPPPPTHTHTHTHTYTQSPVTRSFDVSSMCVWTNGRENSRYVDDLRRHGTDCEVTVIYPPVNCITRHLKSPVSRLFTQSFVRAQIKENIKALRHWPLWGEFTGDQWIPRTKGQ